MCTGDGRWRICRGTNITPWAGFSGTRMVRPLALSMVCACGRLSIRAGCGVLRVGILAGPISASLHLDWILGYQIRWEKMMFSRFDIDLIWELSRSGTAMT